MLHLAQQPVEVSAIQRLGRRFGLLDALDAGSRVGLEDAGNYRPSAKRGKRRPTCGGQAALRLVVAGLVLRTLDKCLR